MPFKHEHRARQANPETFQRGTFQRSPLGFPRGIEAIIAKPKGQRTTEIQSIVFDSRVWTAREAIAWLKSHGFSQTLERATGDKAMTKSQMLNEDWNYKPVEKAPLSTAAINNLPDAAFAHILAGGKKDSEGKTVPRSLRLLPHHTGAVTNPRDNKTIDKPRLRNAMARANQINAPASAKASALRHLQAHAKEVLPTSAAAQEKAGVQKVIDEAGTWIAHWDEVSKNERGGAWIDISKRGGVI